MRLIDADELKGKAFADPDDGEYFVYCQDIDEASTVDAVAVVRCKDCKFAHRIDGPREEYSCRCQFCYTGWLPPRHFCGFGERKNKGVK